MQDEVWLVTGGNGFLGKHVLPALYRAGMNFVSPRSSDLDLINDDIEKILSYYSQNRITGILHMAAVCGGIGANKDRPADFVLDNSLMTCKIFSTVKLWAPITHVYTLGSVCAYPKHCPTPFKEDDLWNGYPEETNAPYGTAKRLQLVMQTAFRQQYGVKGVHLIPVNLYGPHDNFDLKTSHVIPALIRKFLESMPDKNVDVWGTGKATREFLYAEDCAEAIVTTLKNKIDYDKPINLGSGKDISILDLAKLIQNIVGHKGNIVLSSSEKEESLDGQPKRLLDVSRAKSVLNFEAKVSLRDGLERTKNWYLENL